MTTRHPAPLQAYIGVLQNISILKRDSVSSQHSFEFSVKAYLWLVELTSSHEMIARGVRGFRRNRHLMAATDDPGCPEVSKMVSKSFKQITPWYFPATSNNGVDPPLAPPVSEI